MITVSRPINGRITTQYIFGENNKPLYFNTVQEALTYLAVRNFTLADILELDFNFEVLDE